MLNHHEFWSLLYNQPYLMIKISLKNTLIFFLAYNLNASILQHALKGL